MHRVLPPEAGDAVGDGQRTGSQGGPQRRSDGWRGTQKLEIFLLRAAFNVFFDIWQFTLVNKFFGHCGVQPVDTQQQYFFSHCLLIV